MQRLEEAAPPRGQFPAVILLLWCFLYRIIIILFIQKERSEKEEESCRFHLEISELLEREQTMCTQKA